MIEVYTDGACKGNPGPGGWGAVIVENGRESAHRGGPVAHTTNQRMEITAAIEGLKRTPKGTRVTLYSDSKYVINTMTKNWKRNANKDLWPQLDTLVVERNVAFEWVRGHAGHPVQEQADKLASSAACLSVSEGPQEPGDGAGASPDKRLSHLNDRGQARMVDISAKDDTERVAVARGRVVMQPTTLELIRKGEATKGDVLATARIAGVMGAKHTPDLIPLCHPLMITGVTVDFELDQGDGTIEITSTARTTGKTGVEMEALTAVTVAALTVYDMCKAVDRGIRIESVRLIRKSGGKSGDILLE